jgi:hypothetical protein
MAQLEEGATNPAENNGILKGMGYRPTRGASGKGKRAAFKTSASDFADDAESQAIVEGLKNVKTTAPTGEQVASPSKWTVKVSDRPGMATRIEVPGARKRNHFDDFEDLHDDLHSAVMALGATVAAIPASKTSAGMSEGEMRGTYELARSLLGNASTSMAKAGVNHTAKNYVRGGVAFGKNQPKADKAIYDIANEVTPKVENQYVKPTTDVDQKMSAADHMKVAAAAYGQVGNLLEGASKEFGQKFENSYGKSGRNYGDAANEIADDYARKLSGDPGYASTINTGSDKVWQQFSVKPIQRNARSLFPGSEDHDINANRTVRAAGDIQAALARKAETGSMKGSVNRADYSSPDTAQRNLEVNTATSHWLANNPAPKFFAGQDWKSKAEYDTAKAAHESNYSAWSAKRDAHAMSVQKPGKARDYLTSVGEQVPVAVSTQTGVAPAAPRTAVEAQSARIGMAQTKKLEARKADDEAFASYAPNLAASAESDRKADLAARASATAEKVVGDAATRSRMNANAQVIADNHAEVYEPMKKMFAGVQKIAIDAQEKGYELHKDVFKHIRDAGKSFNKHSAEVVRTMPYLTDLTKHTDKAMDEVTNAARRLQQSGVNHPVLTGIVQGGEAQLAAGRYSGRLRTVNGGGWSSKPSINTSRIDPSSTLRDENV